MQARLQKQRYIHAVAKQDALTEEGGLERKGFSKSIYNKSKYNNLICVVVEVS